MKQVRENVKKLRESVICFFFASPMSSPVTFPSCFFSSGTGSSLLVSPIISPFYLLPLNALLDVVLFSYRRSCLLFQGTKFWKILFSLNNALKMESFVKQSGLWDFRNMKRCLHEEVFAPRFDRQRHGDG